MFKEIQTPKPIAHTRQNSNVQQLLLFGSLIFFLNCLIVSKFLLFAMKILFFFWNDYLENIYSDQTHFCFTYSNVFAFDSNLTHTRCFWPHLFLVFQSVGRRTEQERQHQAANHKWAEGTVLIWRQKCAVCTLQLDMKCRIWAFKAVT